MGKHQKFNSDSTAITSLKEVDRHHYSMSYEDGVPVEELIRIAIDNATAFHEATGRTTTIEFNRDDITVKVNQDSAFQPVLRRFKFALLTHQSANEEDHIVVIGPDYPDHLSRSEQAKAKELQRKLRRAAKAEARKRRRAHHKAGRDARARNAYSRSKPTTKARHGRIEHAETDIDLGKTEELDYEELNARYEAELAVAQAINY